MESTIIDPRPTGRAIRMMIASAILAAAFLASALVLKRASDADQAARVAASLAALGTLACAAFAARDNRYPRWAYWSGAGVLSIALLASPFTAVSSTQWIDVVHDSTWMSPWSFILLTMLPTPRRGACAPASSLSGWLLIGCATLLGAILLVATRVAF